MNPLALIAAAASMGGPRHSLSLLTVNHRPLSQSPPYNQRKARKARKARRAAHARGDRKAFL